MIFEQNIILDYEIDNVGVAPEWWDFADDDYVEMELTQDNKVIISGDTTHDLIIAVIDNFLKGVAFGTKKNVTVIYGIKTPTGYYECERKEYEWRDNK